MTPKPKPNAIKSHPPLACPSRLLPPVSRNTELATEPLPKTTKIIVPKNSAKYFIIQVCSIIDTFYSSKKISEKYTQD
jgi:hypothetical protein